MERGVPKTVNFAKFVHLTSNHGPDQKALPSLPREVCQ